MRMCFTHRRMMLTLANQLSVEGKNEKAENILMLAKEKFPSSIVPYDMDDLDIAMVWMDINKHDEAMRVINEVLNYSIAYLEWLDSLSDKKLATYARNCERAMSVVLHSYHLVKSMNQLNPEISDKIDRTLMMKSARLGYQRIEQGSKS
jgi:hypothetical protein